MDNITIPLGTVNNITIASQTKSIIRFITSDIPTTAETVCTITVQQEALCEVILQLKTVQEKISLVILCILEQPGAAIRLRGCLEINAGHAITLTTTQLHTAKATVSELQVHTAVHKKGIFNAISSIKIQEHAYQTNTGQKHKVLLLAQDSHATVQPILEVVPNMVTCSHGAAIGPLAQRSLLYMQSRGISPETASHLLKDAHLAEPFLVPLFSGL